MGAVIRRDGWLWDWFSRLFRLKGFEGGEITLGHGTHEVRVDTAVTPTAVWLSMTVPDGSGTVCYGDLTAVGVRPGDNHFTLYADVKDNVLVVNWFIQW